MQLPQFFLVRKIISEIKWPVIALITFISTGTLLFYHFEKDTYLAAGEEFNYFIALYYVLVTISTIGYGDYTPTTVEGRYVTVGIIVFGLGLISVSINSITQRIIKNAIDFDFRARQEISRFSNHVIIAGYSSVGKRIAQSINLWDTQVAVIDEKEERVKEARADGFSALTGNVATIENLKKANISRAKSIIFTFKDTDTILFSARAARLFNDNPDDLVIIAESDPKVVPKLYRTSNIITELNRYEYMGEKLHHMFTGVRLEKTGFEMPDGVEFLKIPNFASEDEDNLKKILSETNFHIMGKIIGGEFIEIKKGISLQDADEIFIAGNRTGLDSLIINLQSNFVQLDDDKRLVIVGYGELGRSIMSAAFDYADQITIVEHDQELRTIAEQDFHTQITLGKEKSHLLIKQLKTESRNLISATELKQSLEQLQNQYTDEESRVLDSKIKRIMLQIKEIEESIEKLGDVPNIETSILAERSYTSTTQVHQQISQFQDNRSHLQQHLDFMMGKLLGYEIELLKHENKSDEMSKKENQLKRMKLDITNIKRLISVEVINTITHQITKKIYEIESIEKVSKLDSILLRIIHEEYNLKKISITSLIVKSETDDSDFIEADKLILTSQSIGTMSSIAMHALEVNPTIDILARTIDNDQSKLVHSISEKITVLNPENEISTRLVNQLVQQLFNKKSISFDNGQLLFYQGNVLDVISLKGGRKVLASYSKHRSLFDRIFFRGRKRIRETRYNVRKSLGSSDYNLDFIKANFLS
ncbi:MAG: NAD-binding protein [Candidatus Heimdallarchaeota archaeon]|nr:NAD-binding protein [Candidatus Heimdallarchaeota archaeon]